MNMQSLLFSFQNNLIFVYQQYKVYIKALSFTLEMGGAVKQNLSELH